MLGKLAQEAELDFAGRHGGVEELLAGEGVVLVLVQALEDVEEGRVAGVGQARLGAQVPAGPGGGVVARGRAVGGAGRERAAARERVRLADGREAQLAQVQRDRREGHVLLLGARASGVPLERNWYQKWGFVLGICSGKFSFDCCFFSFCYNLLSN